MRVFSMAALFACSVYAQNVSSGLNAGARIPAFSLQDQNGRTQTFASIKGPKGAVLVFFRSADW
jgi:hypothetical protein